MPAVSTCQVPIVIVSGGKSISPNFDALLAIAAFALAALVIGGYRTATSDPIVRRLSIVSGDYPPGAAPIRIVLLSDLHVRRIDMPLRRLKRIVQQVNALNPDIVLIAGDFVGRGWPGEQYSPAEATAPLGSLKARKGVYAVLGNNDSNITYSLLPALRRAKVGLISNDAQRVGPIAVGGIDGRFARTPGQRHQARRLAYRALASTPGFKVVLAHGPDEFASAPNFVRLMLAGHTHCGQIVLPLLGALVTGSKLRIPYICGVYRRGAAILVVTSGLGTSHLPLRIGASPDVWLVTIRGNGAHLPPRATIDL